LEIHVVTHILSRLLCSTAAFAIAVLPAQAAGTVIYRATSDVVKYDVFKDVPAPGTVAATPLSVETTGSLSVAYGAPVSFRLDPKGGTQAGWVMTYTGARPDPSRVQIAESGKDVVVTAPAGLPDGSYGPFSVSLTDGKNTVTKSVTLVVQPTSSPLAVVSSAGASASYEGTTAWNFAFTASGGKGPYTFSTVALTGDLASVVKTPTASGVSFSGTAPVGVYAIYVDATDSLGKTVRATTTVTVTKPATLTLRPVSIDVSSSPAPVVMRQSTDQPDWNLLYDGQSATSIRARDFSAPAGLVFASDITFDRVFVKMNNNGVDIKIWIKENNAWKEVKSTKGTSAGGVVVLDGTYTTKQVGFSSRDSEFEEFRVGDGGAALPPLLKSGNATVVAAGTTLVATSSMFETRSPYNPGAVSLAATPPSQNGVTMSVTAGEVRITSRPSYTTDIVVVGKTSDDLVVRQKFQILAGASTVSDTPRPTGIDRTQGAPVISATAAGQPQWNLLYDGSTTSNIRTRNTGDPTGVSFDTPVTFDKVFVRMNGAAEIGIFVKEAGTWTKVGKFTGSVAGSVLNLDRPYTASIIGFATNDYEVSEFRVGDVSSAAVP
jgi:hypothetical protein